MASVIILTFSSNLDHGHRGLRYQWLLSEETQDISLTAEAELNNQGPPESRAPEYQNPEPASHKGSMKGPTSSPQRTLCPINLAHQSRQGSKPEGCPFVTLLASAKPEKSSQCHGAQRDQLRLSICFASWALLWVLRELPLGFLFCTEPSCLFLALLSSRWLTGCAPP